MTGYSLNSIVAKYPIYRDWDDVPDFIRPGKWVQATEDWNTKYQIYKPFQVAEQKPLEYEDGIMIRSNPEYGIFINCAHIEAHEQPAGSQEWFESENTRLTQALAEAEGRLESAKAALLDGERDRCPCESCGYSREFYLAIRQALAVLEGTNESEKSNG